MRLTRNLELLVLVPAYNEADNLPAVVGDLRAHVPGADILVIDDESTDRTTDVLQQLGVLWIRMPQRLGTGAAVRTGLRYARDNGYRIVVRVDGDNQHPAAAIPGLLAVLAERDCDVVVGSRYAAEQAAGTTPRVRRLVHSALGRVLSIFTRQLVTDPTSGFWAFGRRALNVLGEHHPSGYPEPELLLFLSRNGITVKEVPIVMRDRLTGKTSLTPTRTGAAFARLLLLLIVVPLRSTIAGRHD